MKKYFSFFAAALLMTFAACNNVDEPNDGGGTTVGNDGSKEKPFTVSEAITKQGQTDKWVKGYIVGAIKGLTIAPDSVELAAPFTGNTNLLIAESATETDLSKMMPVQLSAGAFREALNLPAHPTNLGKEVMLKGALTAYFSKPGIKTLSDIVFEGYIPPATTIDICSDATFAGHSTYSNDFEDAVDKTDYINEGWQNIAVTENRRFQGKAFQDNLYVQATAHGGTAGKKYESWIVSPGLNLEGAASKTVKVKLGQGYTKESTVFEVYVLQCKNGETVQTKITPSAMPPAAPNGYSPLTDASLDLSAFTGKVHIGFRYVGDGGQSLSTTWQIDDFSFNKDIVGETKVSFTSAATANVYKGKALNYTIRTSVANGKGNTVITATGTPSWITFTDNGDGTATLTGTAPATTGTSEISLTATNNSVEATQTLNVVVSEEPAAGDNLVPNGNFDTFADGKFTNWTITPSDKITLSQDASGKEGQSLKATSPIETTKLYQQVTLEAGKTYTLSYWYKASVAKFRIWSGFASTAGVITGITYPGATADTDEFRTNNKYYDPASDWTFKTHEFTMPADKTIFQLEFRYYGSAGSEFGLDEVKIVKK